MLLRLPQGLHYPITVTEVRLLGSAPTPPQSCLESHLLERRARRLAHSPMARSSADLEKDGMVVRIDARLLGFETLQICEIPMTSNHAAEGINIVRDIGYERVAAHVIPRIWRTRYCLGRVAL